MEVILTLCEAATNHPDGTFSMLRAGLVNWHVPGPPFQLNADLLAEFRHHPEDAGDHTAHIKMIYPTGDPDVMTATFPTPPNEGVIRIATKLNLSVGNPGRIRFQVELDGEDSAEVSAFVHRVSASPASQEQAAK